MSAVLLLYPLLHPNDPQTTLVIAIFTPSPLQDLLAVLGGFVGALRVPEKWVPGRLDLLANSHHIMHVVVVYAVYHLHQGAVLDLVWLSGNTTCQHPAFVAAAAAGIPPPPPPPIPTPTPGL